MTQLDSYSSIVDTLLLDRERRIRLSNAHTRAASALTMSETNPSDDGAPQRSERRCIAVPQINLGGAVVPSAEVLRQASSENATFFISAGEQPGSMDDGRRRRIRIVALGANTSEASIAPRAPLTAFHTAVSADASLWETIELCYNDGRAAAKQRTVNIQIIDASGCRVYWDRTPSGSWAGTWADRPDLGPMLVSALKTAGVTPAGIHIGDDEAFTRRQVTSIDSAADSLRRSGYQVVVKR